MKLYEFDRLGNVSVLVMGSSGVAYCIEKQIARKRSLLHIHVDSSLALIRDTLKSVDNQKCESILPLAWEEVEASGR